MTDYEVVKSKIDLAEFISSKAGEPIRSVGASLGLDKCPFCGGHDCFRINPGKQLFNCFQCDKGGDAFAFLELQGVEKRDALLEAAKYAGISIKRPTPEKTSVRQRILHDAVTYYERCLWRDGRATYLRDERRRSQATLETMRVGYADGGLTEHLLKAGYGEEDVVNTGIAKKNGHGGPIDFFRRGLFIYPHLAGKKILHLTQKDPAGKSKYQLGNKHRSESWRFYNQDALGRYDEVIICEGENDVQAWMDAGVNNAMALIGQPSNEQIKAIRNHCSKKRVYLCFDNDDAGRGYTRKIVEALAGPEYNVQVVDYRAKDIDEHLKGFSGEKICVEARRLLSAAIHPVHWDLLQVGDTEDLAARLRHLKEHNVFERIAEMVEVEKEVYVDKLIGLGFSRKAVEEQIEQGSNLLNRVAQYMESLPNKRDACPNTLSSVIFKGFTDRGRWFYDREDHCYLFYRKRIYKVGGNRPFNALLKKHTNLLPTKEPGRSVWESLASEVYNFGIQVEVMSWLHTDYKTNTIFVNLNSSANTILKVKANSIEEIPNGTNPDEVLLNSSKKIMPFNYLSGCKISEGMKLLKELVFDNLACEQEQRYFILTWFMSCFLVDFAPYTGLAKFSGSRGSGKSTAAELLSTIIYGDPHLSNPTASAAYTVASNSPLLVLDDKEEENITKSLDEFLRHAATRGSKEKRRGGTDDQTLEESPKSLVIVTAIDPFSNPQVVSRTYDFEFSAKYQEDDFIKMKTLQMLLQNRDLILTSILKFIAHYVLPNIDKITDYHAVLRKEYRGHSKQRTNEFICILMLMLDSLLQYIPYYGKDDAILFNSNGSDIIWKKWIRYQDKKTKETESGTSPIITLLNMLWKEYEPCFDKKTHGAYHEEAGKGGIAKPLDYNIKMSMSPEGNSVEFDASSHDLYMVFGRLCKNIGFKMPYRNPRQLGVRLVNEEAALNEEGWWLVRNRDDSPYFKIVNGDRKYRLKKVLS